MRKISLMLIILTISFGLFSQDFEIPKNPKLETDENYAFYEQDIINCVNWLMNTPIKEQTEKRRDANAFLLMWLTGSPNVNIEINQQIVTFMASSPELLMIFMGGWAKNALETKEPKNKIAGNLAGIEAVIEFYTKNKLKMGKDKNVEKYVKMKETGTLKEFIEKNA
jgi:hypothetical protein